MNAEDQSAASDASEQTAPQVDAEQQTAKPGSLSEFILNQAAAEEKAAATEKKPEEQPKPEDTPLAQPEDEPAVEPTAEEVSEKEPEAEKPEERPGDRQVPLREVLKERDKKERANARADKADEARIAAENRAAELERQLVSLSGPQPREDDPVIDIQTPIELDTLERNYERFIDAVDDAEPNEEGVIEGVLVGRKSDGSELRKDLTVKEVEALKRKADKAIRKYIPERRTFLKQRKIEDEIAIEAYPELKDQNSEFTQAFAYLANQVTSGRAVKDPTLHMWIAHAVRGYQEYVKRNAANAAGATSDASRQILKSAKQAVAPSTTRTRTVPVRRGADEADAKKQFAEKPDSETADKLIAARLFKRTGSAEALESYAE